MIKVLTVVANMSEGGGQHMIYELIRHMNTSKYQMELLCYAGRVNSALEKKIEKVCNIDYLNENGTLTIGSYRRVFRTIKKYNPDIVHAHLGGMAFAVPWALLGNKRRLVITAHTKPQVAFDKKIEPLIRFLLKYRKKTTKVIAVSEENFHLLQEYLNIESDVSAFVNNGVDLDRFYREKHSLFTYINVARQDENKNQAAIIKAFHKIHLGNKDTKLILVGDGPCHNALKNLVKKLELEDNIEMPGMVGNVEDYYAQSDCYVQASHREAMPLSALEAMAAKLPIISTDVGGMKEIVKENGYLISDNDDDQLYEKMYRICKVSDKEIKLKGEKSFEIVNGYSSKKMADKYSVIYDELAKYE